MPVRRMFQEPGAVCYLDEQFRLGTKKHLYFLSVAHDACALSNKVDLILCNALIAVNTIISQRII